MSNELQIKTFTNGFGISKLTINNTENSVNNSLFNNIIYSPNGIFKTSFARTFYNLSRNIIVNDRITNNNFQGLIFIDGVDINSIDLKQKIIVFTKEIMDNTKLSDLQSDFKSLAIVDELVIELNSIYNEIDLIINNLTEKVNKIGFDNSALSILTNVKPENKFEFIASISKKMQSTNIIDLELKIDKQVFSSETYGKLDNFSVRAKVNSLTKYTEKNANQSIFDDDFTVFIAIAFLKDLKDKHWLSNERDRGIVLKGKTYYDIEEFENDLNLEISKILESPDAQKQSDDVLKVIGNKKKEEKKVKERYN